MLAETIVPHDDASHHLQLTVGVGRAQAKLAYMVVMTRTASQERAGYEAVASSSRH